MFFKLHSGSESREVGWKNNSDYGWTNKEKIVTFVQDLCKFTAI
jgi:hypothetical protein